MDMRGSAERAGAAAIASRPALGSATLRLSLYQLRAPWGGPQFHPPGEHPATYVMREQRAKMADLLNRMPTAAMSAPDGAYRQTCEALAYLDRRLAEFEAAEMEAKRRAWHYLCDRVERASS